MVPNYKNIPKYDHVSQACINPSPSKPRPLPRFHPEQVECESSPVRMDRRVREKKELSPRLLRVPIDPNAPVRKPKVFLDTKGLTNRQKRDKLEEARQRADELMKAKRVEKNRTLLFQKIIEQLNSRQEGEWLNDKVKVCAGMLVPRLNDKSFLSTLWQMHMNRSGDEDGALAGKPEIVGFLKSFLPEMRESEIDDFIFIYKSKSYKARATNESFNSQDANLKMDMGLIDPLFDKWLIN